MTSLETFLKADDLDALLRAREDISLTPEESALVASVIHDWSDRQAVSNLLFHSDLIPATLRFEANKRLQPTAAGAIMSAAAETRPLGIVRVELRLHCTPPSSKAGPHYVAAPPGERVSTGEGARDQFSSS